MDLLDIRQLRAFQELARRGSFTEAATHLHLTQSAVSHSIKALEGHLQISLFDRLGKKVRLTDEGEAFLPHVDAIIDRMEKAVDDVMHRHEPGHGKLRIGATSAISQFVLPAVLRELRDCFPNYEIAITTADDISLMAMLEKGQLDTVIAMEAFSVPRIVFAPLFTDTIEMALAPSHPLASVDVITSGDVVGKEFIICSDQSDTYRQVDRIFTGMGGRLRTSLQVGSMAAIKEMAKINLGIGLLAPWVALDEIRSGALIFKALPEGDATRTWGIYTNDRKTQNLTESVFAGLCRSVFANLQIQSEGTGVAA